MCITYFQNKVYKWQTNDTTRWKCHISLQLKRWWPVNPAHGHWRCLHFKLLNFVWMMTFWFQWIRHWVRSSHTIYNINISLSFCISSKIVQRTVEPKIAHAATIADVANTRVSATVCLYVTSHSWASRWLRALCKGNPPVTDGFPSQ